MGELVIGLTTYFTFYNEERPHQSLDYEMPATVHQAASGSSEVIFEKYGDSVPETPDPLLSSEISGSIVKDVRNNRCKNGAAPCGCK